LICNICECHTSTVASNLLEKDSLELFREIVLRLPVGPHLSMKILNCLFRIVERQYQSSSATQQQQQHDSGVQQMEENNALLAVEILCDVMSKKYLPRNDDQGAGAGGGGEDSGALVLVELIAQAVGLLQQMSSSSNGSSRSMEDISTVLPLFEFINLFVEYHIERCMASSLRHPKASAVMEVFLNELSNLTRACSHPDYLYKVCVIWKGLLEDEVAKYAVLQNENCLQAGVHIFQAGLLQNNSTLESVRCSICPIPTPSLLSPLPPSLLPSALPAPFFHPTHCPPSLSSLSLADQFIDDIEDDFETNPFQDEKIKHILFPIQRRSESSKDSSTSLSHNHHKEGSAAYNVLQIITTCIVSPPSLSCSLPHSSSLSSAAVADSLLRIQSIHCLCGTSVSISSARNLRDPLLRFTNSCLCSRHSLPPKVSPFPSLLFSLCDDMRLTVRMNDDRLMPLCMAPYELLPPLIPLIQNMVQSTPTLPLPPVSLTIPHPSSAGNKILQSREILFVSFPSLLSGPLVNSLSLSPLLLSFLAAGGVTTILFAHCQQLHWDRNWCSLSH
jgi:hypothetical protein